MGIGIYISQIWAQSYAFFFNFAILTLHFLKKNEERQLPPLKNSHFLIKNEHIKD